MINRHAVRELFESSGSDAAPVRRAQTLQRRVLHMMGLTDARGNRYRDAAGNAELRESVRDDSGRDVPRLRPSEFSLEQLGRGILGHDLFEEAYRPDSTFLVNAGRQLLEATGEGAINASAFANINAFTGVVAGLLEVSILEAFENVEFIADKLMPAVDTKIFEGRKVVGTGRFGDVAEERLPGNPTKRVQFGERWILQPRTVENALAVEVTQEAVYLDQTGEVLEQATNLGDWLAYRKEIRCLDAFLGITNTYSYNGTNYSTYISNGFYNNDLSGNELVHWDQLQTVLLAFRDMLDPTTNTRIRTAPDAALVNMEKLVTARAVFGDLADTVQYRDAPGSTTSPQEIRSFKSPYKGQFEILTSPLVYQRCTDASGLGLSATTAGKYWWVWQKGKAFKYAQNWPLRVQQAAPQQVDMLDRGVILYCKADERGIPMVYEPRYVVRSHP